jgi:hypothetical protein
MPTYTFYNKEITEMMSISERELLLKTFNCGDGEPVTYDIPAG